MYIFRMNAIYKFGIERVLYVDSRAIWKSEYTYTSIDKNSATLP